MCLGILSEQLGGKWNCLSCRAQSSVISCDADFGKHNFYESPYPDKKSPIVSVRVYNLIIFSVLFFVNSLLILKTI